MDTNTKLILKRDRTSLIFTLCLLAFNFCWWLTTVFRFTNDYISLTHFTVVSSICVVFIIWNTIDVLHYFTAITTYKDWFKGFGGKSDILFRSGIDYNTYSGVVVDKKIINDNYCFLVKNSVNEYMTFDVDRKTYYMKNVGSNVNITIDRNRVYIPGIICSKYVEDEIFYVQVVNKYGLFEYSVDFIEWEKIDGVQIKKIDVCDVAI